MKRTFNSLVFATFLCATFLACRNEQPASQSDNLHVNQSLRDMAAQAEIDSLKSASELYSWENGTIKLYYPPQDMQWIDDFEMDFFQTIDQESQTCDTVNGIRLVPLSDEFYTVSFNGGKQTMSFSQDSLGRAQTIVTSKEPLEVFVEERLKLTKG